jgi:glycosyltransferase involved in cell wall biosynthesis
MPVVSPALAVVMPVRNAAPYLDAAVRSILGQTFTDFEFVALDDGSTDGSGEILERWAARDKRMRVERSCRPLGLVDSSNFVVGATKAPLVARMDADDVAHPDRLARQVGVLARDSRVVLAGTLFEGIDEDGRVVRPIDRWRLLRPSPFAPFPHGSVAFRRESFEAVGGYARHTEYWEDLSLFRRLGEQGRVLVLPEALYQYRFHGSGSRLTGDEREVQAAVGRMLYAVQSAGRPLKAHEALVSYSLAASRLWAGQPPRLLKDLRLRWFLPPDPTTVAIAAIALTSALSPKAVRFVMSRVIWLRDHLASLKIGPEPLEWHFA